MPICIFNCSRPWWQRNGKEQCLSHEQLTSMWSVLLLPGEDQVDGRSGRQLFPVCQTHLSHYILALYLLMSEMLLLNWKCCFYLQLWNLCGLIAKLMIYTLMLHLGPSCLSLMALGNTAAAMMTWPRGWQDLTCLFLPMTMVSSLNQYLIYGSSGLYWSKCH